jgi:hypothetical protein
MKKKVKLADVSDIDKKYHKPLLKKLNDANIAYSIKKGSEIWVDDKEFIMASILMLRVIKTK